jgi:hypothetical protein
MLKAVIKGTNKFLSIEEFKSKYGLKSLEEGMELECPACKNKLYVYGITSIRVGAGFHHYPNTSCIYVDDHNEYLSTPKEWNLENGNKIRTALKNKEFISKLYCFCLKLCGKKKLSIDKFLALINKADKRNLWACSGLEEWILGFLLLVLDDFQGELKEPSSPRKIYTFRFFLKKGDAAHTKEFAQMINHSSKIDLEDLLTSEQYYLFKVFGNGKLMDQDESNPYPVNRETWKHCLADYQWFFENLGDKYSEINSRGAMLNTVLSNEQVRKLLVAINNNPHCQIGVMNEGKIFQGKRHQKPEVLILLTGFYIISDLFGHLFYNEEKSKWVSSLIEIDGYFSGKNDQELIDDFWENIKKRKGFCGCYLDFKHLQQDVILSDSFGEATENLICMIKRYVPGHDYLEGFDLYDVYDPEAVLSESYRARITET